MRTVTLVLCAALIGPGIVRRAQAEPPALPLLGLTPAGLYAAPLAPSAPVPCAEYYVEELRPLRGRFDLLLGAIVPFESSGLAFGAATSDEDFGAGAAVGMRVQFQAVRQLFVGVEVDFATHPTDEGDVLLEGDLDRIYFLFPVSLALPLGPPESPFQVDFSIAPGLQLADPDVDHGFEAERADFFGEFYEQETIVAFNLRVAVALRAPLGRWAQMFIEVSYDWAYGEGETSVFDDFGFLIERRRDEVDLSGLTAMLGLSFLF